MANPTTVPTGKPCWSREAAIGDYGGDPAKRASETEGDAPYAWFCYRELVAMRGSAYSQSIGGTLVHCENLATARLMSWWGWRMPEKFRANSVPHMADEGLAYWVKVQGIPTRPGDQKWQLRQRAAAHYRAVTDVSLPAIQAALQTLLGDVYVNATFNYGSSLGSPPALTFWPGVNPGPASYSLGAGAWLSERSHLFVQVNRPPSMPDGDFLQLMNVQLFQLLHRMLPAFCTFNWATSDGFLLDISQLDFDGLT